VAAKNDASYDLSRARASVTGQTTNAASTATTSLPNGRIVTALFAGALFFSAFLLFVLEPMVAKSILPTLGGTPMAWNRASVALNPWTLMRPRRRAMTGSRGLSARFGSLRRVCRPMKTLGVADVCFAKKRGLLVREMTRSQWVYDKLRRFRAGIEAGISLLKRVFGLARCVWTGAAGFHAYVRTAVLAANLLLLARARLS